MGKKSSVFVTAATLVVMAVAISRASEEPCRTDRGPPPELGPCLMLNPSLWNLVEILWNGDRPLREQSTNTVRWLRECADVIERFSVDPEPEPSCGTPFTPPCAGEAVVLP